MELVWRPGRWKRGTGEERLANTDMSWWGGHERGTRKEERSKKKEKRSNRKEELSMRKKDRGPWQSRG